MGGGGTALLQRGVDEAADDAVAVHDHPGGFEHPGEWTQSDTWFLHRGGGFVLYDQAKPHGRIAFTMKPRRSRNSLRGGPRLRWVVGYSDARNR